MNLADLLRQSEEKKVYRQLEVELTDQTFDAPRSYGHATYRVVGGHAEWHTVRDAKKIYGFLNQENRWIFEYPGTKAGFCLAVVRLGGYSGMASRQLADILEPHRQRLMDIRGVPAEKSRQVT